MSRFKVAVVVLADVDAVDEADAGHGATLAVRSTIAGHPRNPLPAELSIPIRNVDKTARVVAVMDLGIAARNGYLWTSPTAKAWRQFEGDR